MSHSDDTGKSTEARLSRRSTGARDGPSTDAEPLPAVADDVTIHAPPLPDAQRRHLRRHLGEHALANAVYADDDAIRFQPLTISLRNVRANSRVLVTIRNDQQAAWSEGDGHGLVGLSFATNVDPALYLSSFLINAREFFLQTYADSQEVLVQLYVRTGQRELRGRVDLPPGTVATLQSRSDRSSVVGLSAFAIDF